MQPNLLKPEKNCLTPYRIFGTWSLFHDKKQDRDVLVFITNYDDQGKEMQKQKGTAAKVNPLRVEFSCLPEFTVLCCEAVPKNADGSTSVDQQRTSEPSKSTEEKEPKGGRRNKQLSGPKAKNNSKRVEEISESSKRVTIASWFIYIGSAFRKFSLETFDSLKPFLCRQPNAQLQAVLSNPVVKSFLTRPEVTVVTEGLIKAISVQGKVVSITPEPTIKLGKEENKQRGDAYYMYSLSFYDFTLPHLCALRTPCFRVRIKRNDLTLRGTGDKVFTFKKNGVCELEMSGFSEYSRKKLKKMNVYNSYTNGDNEDDGDNNESVDEDDNRPVPKVASISGNNSLYAFNNSMYPLPPITRGTTNLSNNNTVTSSIPQNFVRCNTNLPVSISSLPPATLPVQTNTNNNSLNDSNNKKRKAPENDLPEAKRPKQQVNSPVFSYLEEVFESDAPIVADVHWDPTHVPDIHWEPATCMQVDNNTYYEDGTIESPVQVEEKFPKNNNSKAFFEGFDGNDDMQLHVWESQKPLFGIDGIY